MIQKAKSPHILLDNIGWVIEKKLNEEVCGEVNVDTTILYFFFNNTYFEQFKYQGTFLILHVHIF